MKEMTSRKKQAIATKERIFQCATELFAQKSFEEVKISDICHAANVSTGAFYHHFSTKENILNEGYRDFDAQVKAAWEAYVQTNTYDNIRFLINFQLHAISLNGYIYAMQFFKNQLSNSDKYIINPNRFFNQKIREIVTAAVLKNELCGDTHEITEHILRVSRGTIYDWCLHEGTYELIPRGIKDTDNVLFYYQKR
jgi:AcrR family transcriptional regulator